MHGREPESIIRKMPIPALILAAGRGRRLSPLTDDLPKGLLPIGNTSSLELILALLDRPEVTEAAIVVGHARERITSFLRTRKLSFPVREIFNPRYDAANNICSVDVARDLCSGGFLLINSDVVFHPGILDAALAPPDENLLVVDSTLPPRDEAMRVRFEDSRLAAIGKDLDPAKCDGEYIGIARFDTRGARAFFARISEILAEGGSGEWYEAAIGRAAAEVSFRQRTTRGLPWIEIDDREDLERAVREVAPRLGLSEGKEK